MLLALATMIDQATCNLVASFVASLLVISIVVSRPIGYVVSIVIVSPVKVSMEVDTMSPVFPTIVDIQRIVGMPMSVMIAVPGAESPINISVRVVVAKVIVAIAGANPKMIEGTREINNDARSIAYVAMMTEVARSEQGPAILPTIIPVARYVVTAIHSRHVVVRNPNPTGVTARPETGAPNVSLILISPDTWHPKSIFCRRITRWTFFQ